MDREASALTGFMDTVEELGLEVLRRLDLLGGSKAQGELSHVQYRAVSLIDSHGPISVGSLGQMLGTTQSTTSEMVTRLKRGGLISKSRGRRDGRIVEVALTEKGRALLTGQREVMCAAFRRVFDKLTPDERESLGRSLESAVSMLTRP